MRADEGEVVKREPGGARHAVSASQSIAGRIAAAMIIAEKRRPRTSRSFQSARRRDDDPAGHQGGDRRRCAWRGVSSMRVPIRSPARAALLQKPPYTNSVFARYNGRPMAADELVVHGAREHNLKDITVRLPRNALICITGLSGSGKSSLAFDTIYAEGQRRYVESLSAYARQFLQMMEKPDVDSIDGLSPAISIDQKTTSRNPRSTVGTVTEIYDYLRLLYARVGRPHCPIAAGRSRASRSTRSSSRSSRCPRARASPSTRRSCATGRASSATSSSSSATRASRASRSTASSTRSTSRRRSTRSSSTRSRSSSTGS